MNNDLDKIVELLKKRFPRSRIKMMRSGNCGPNPLVSVVFESVGDAVFAFGDEPGKGKTVYMGVNEHIDNEDFKTSGYDLFDFKYQGPEHLVKKFVEGAKILYQKQKEFEDMEDRCDRGWGIRDRNPSDPALAPALSAEINLGESMLVVGVERETY